MANEIERDNESILRAAHAVGGQAELARQLGVVAVTVNQWAKNKRPVPDDKCVGIELATAGEVTVEQLAPARTWVRVAEKGWPHPKGKPLIDVAPANDESKARA